MLEIIKKICVDNNATPIVILKTPRAGDTVDNMMGVEHDLNEYALIFKYHKNYSSNNSKLSYAFYSLEPRISITQLDIDNIKSIDEMIQELHDTDDYEVIWRDDSYKDPKKMVSMLNRDGIYVELSLTTLYSLKVTFDEIRRYCDDKSCGYSYNSDFFYDAIRDHPDFDKVVNNHTYPRDSATLKETYLNDDAIIFVFECKNKKRIGCDNGNYSDDDLSKVVGKFEDSDDIFDSLSDSLKSSLQGIIADATNLKGDIKTNVSSFRMARKRSLIK